MHIYAVPMDIPGNFTIHLETVNSTGAEFSWRSVDSSRFRVQGVFTGYQVVLAKYCRIVNRGMTIVIRAGLTIRGAPY